MSNAKRKPVKAWALIRDNIVNYSYGPYHQLGIFPTRKSAEHQRMQRDRIIRVQITELKGKRK